MKNLFLLPFIALLFMSSPAHAQPCDMDKMSKELEKARKKEQQIRREMMPVVAEYQRTGNGIFKLLRFKNKMDRIDAENQQLLIEWTDQCGWPDQLTEEAHSAVYLIVQHAELDLLNKFIDQVHDKVQKGILAPDDYATMYDRIAMYEGRAQKYGTQTFQMPNAGSDGNNTNTVWPVLNLDSLENWRAQVSLPPMDTYFKLAQDSMGITMVLDTTLTLEIANRIKGR